MAFEINFSQFKIFFGSMVKFTTNLSETLICETNETKSFIKHEISGSGELKLGKDSSVWMIENFLKDNLKKQIIDELEEHSNFFLRPMGAYGNKIPRGQCAFGEGQYNYGKLSIAALPAPTGIQSLMTEISHQSNLQNLKFVLVNKYQDGNDSVGLHADDEETLNYEDPIFSLSLGASRNFVIRPSICNISKPKPNAKNKIEFGPYNPELSKLFVHKKVPYSKISISVRAKDNLMLVMAGKRFQSDFVHEVPKEPKVIGVRYNLTFRSMKI
jgi:hypothetical protein